MKVPALFVFSGEFIKFAVFAVFAVLEFSFHFTYCVFG